MLGLCEVDEELISRIVLNRAMLGECEGSNPPFLEPGHTLWAWFGHKSEQEVHAYMAQLMGVLERRPHAKRALSQKDWYIVWHEGKYSLTYRKMLAQRLLEDLGDKLGSVAEQLIDSLEEHKWFVAGIVIGMCVVWANYEPLSAIKVFLFVMVFGFYTVLALLGGMALFSKFVRSLDDERSPWTRIQSLLFALVLVLAAGIGVSMAIWLPKDVRLDNDPWREEVEQTDNW